MGELAAIATSICWTFSAVMFTWVGRKAGSVAVNRMRLLFALGYLLIAHLLFYGTPIPWNAQPDRWFWLGLSGIIGLTFGDLALYQAYILIGPAIGSLIMTASPVLSVVLAFFFLGETIPGWGLVGIFGTMAGIALVVIARRNPSTATHHERRTFWLGLFFGFLSALANTIGLVLTKRGLLGDFPALSGVVIRILVGTTLMWAPAIFSGKVKSSLALLKDRQTLMLLAAGSFVGPFAGIWFSTIAVQKTAVGIAATLTSLSPIFLIPVSARLFNEKVSLKAVIGTLIALAGVAVLFLYNP